MRRTTKFKGGGILVWGCILKTGVGLLLRVHQNVTGSVYCKIIRRMLDELPLLQSADEEEKLIFQQDNASCHTSRLAEYCMNRNELTVLPWPPLSPDLSPIENVWATMVSSLRNAAFKNSDDLWDAVQRAWFGISQEHITQLYNSVPRRIRTVIKSRGDSTRY